MNTDHRVRWAAIGAAVAVTPCRLVDTRNDPDFHVGAHATLAAQAQIAIAGWGSQGECTSPALPADTTGLQLNVTALGATAPTFLTVFPGTGTPPNASSLNPTPGQPPAPNAVTTQLDDTGTFSVYNAFGSVDVIVDVVGYFTPTDHEHPTPTPSPPTTSATTTTTTGPPSAPLDHEHASDDLVDESGVAFSETTHSPALVLTSGTTTVATVRLRPPADGWVTVHADITWWGTTPGLDAATCQITKATTYAGTEPYLRLHDFAGDSNVWNPTTSAHRTFPVAVADNSDSPTLGTGQDFNVVCRELTGDVRIDAVSVTAQYFPTSYLSVAPAAG